MASVGIWMARCPLARLRSRHRPHLPTRRQRHHLLRIHRQSHHPCRAAVGHVAAQVIGQPVASARVGMTSVRDGISYRLPQTLSSQPVRNG
jgi:hypothetical protein